MKGKVSWRAGGYELECGGHHRDDCSALIKGDETSMRGVRNELFSKGWMQGPPGDLYNCPDCVKKIIAATPPYLEPVGCSAVDG